ncbi:MAG: inorganic diphosphatase [archaeon]|nr:inorganic diphosphatase [archaeon]
MKYPQFTKSQIEHFFLDYKETEPNKFARVKGWGDAQQSKKLIREAIEACKGSQDPF